MCIRDSESNAAPQRTRSMFSLKRITAKNIAKIGFRNVIAVASLIGMYKTAVNKIETPKQPKNDRRKCKRLFNDSIFGLIKQHTIVKNINEKKKRVIDMYIKPFNHQHINEKFLL